MGETQTVVLRRMTPAERLEAALRLYWSAGELKAAAMRGEHSEWSEAEVREAVKKAFMYASG